MPPVSKRLLSVFSSIILELMGSNIPLPTGSGAHRPVSAAAEGVRTLSSTAGAPSIAEAIFPHLQPAAARRLLLSAHDVFAAKGYHAATTREIAAGAAMSPAAMYIHYRSKQDLLFQLSLLGHEACEAVITAAVAGSAGPVDQLRSMIGAFARWHAANHTTARIVQYELASLTRDHFDAVASIRRRIEKAIRSVIDDGVAQGLFALNDVAGTALAVTSLSVDVARWFPAGDLHAPADVELLYGELALRLVGYHGND